MAQGIGSKAEGESAEIRSLDSYGFRAFFKHRFMWVETLSAVFHLSDSDSAFGATKSPVARTPWKGGRCARLWAGKAWRASCSRWSETQRKGPGVFLSFLVFRFGPLEAKRFWKPRSRRDVQAQFFSWVNMGTLATGLRLWKIRDFREARRGKPLPKPMSEYTAPSAFACWRPPKRTRQNTSGWLSGLRLKLFFGLRTAPAPTVLSIRFANGPGDPPNIGRKREEKAGTFVVLPSGKALYPKSLASTALATALTTAATTALTTAITAATTTAITAAFGTLEIVGHLRFETLFGPKQLGPGC